MLSRLDSLLKTTKEKEPLYLLRGQIHLARGEGKKALEDFQRAAGSRDKQVRLAAWLGQSRTHRTIFRDNYRAERACRSGLSIDDNPELFFEKALVGFSYGGSDGYRQAGKYLMRLIAVDPAHQSAYRVWRDSLLYHPR